MGQAAPSCSPPTQLVLELQVLVGHAEYGLHSRHPAPRSRQVRSWPPLHSVVPVAGQGLPQVPQALAVSQKPLGQSERALQARHPWASAWQLRILPSLHSAVPAAGQVWLQLPHAPAEQNPLGQSEKELQARQPWASA